MSKQPKTVWHDRSLVDGPYVTLVFSEEEYLKATKHSGIPKAERGSWLGSPQSNGTCTTFTMDSKLICIVAVQLEAAVENVSVQGLLIHEAVHIWQNYRRHIGETNPSDEFEAYSIQSISQRLLDAYESRLNKAKES